MNLASLIEELTDTLQEEEKVYNNLIPIEEKKTKIIIENDLQALTEITKEEQQVIEETIHLEKKREKIIQNIGIVLNKESKDLNVSIIIDLLKGQEEQKKLREVYHRLRSTIELLMNINNRNKALINQSLDIIEFNMNFYQSLKGEPTNNYNKEVKGYKEEASQPGMFDAKQ